VRSSRIGAVVYWTFAVALIAFGVLGLLSVGLPFLLTGIAMAALAPRRSERVILWPALVGIWAFVLGYVLAGPIGCATTVSAAPGEATAETVSCGNVLGLDYSGGAGYQPPLLPALVVGVVLAVASAWVVRRALRRWSPAVSSPG
jgi:hypothetical protein